VQDCSVEETEDGAAESEAALENPSDCPSFVWEVAQIHYYVYCVQPWSAVGPHCQQHAHLKEAQQQQQQQQLELAHTHTHTQRNNKPINLWSTTKRPEDEWVGFFFSQEK
jgi:hypothetical protein